MRSGIIFILVISFLVPPSLLMANEVIPKERTAVIERAHPRTGRVFQSIVEQDSKTPFLLFETAPATYLRPDYRLLDSRNKSGDIPYDGPVSSRKKVYVFAGTVATLGVTGGTLGMLAAASAPTVGTSAAGGAGAYLGAGTAVGVGTFSTAWIKSQPDPEKDNFTVSSSTKVMDQKDSAENEAA